jgi:hypothetical protein
LYGAEAWTFQKIDQKYQGRFEVWCWRRMEISWIYRVRNEEVLYRFKGEKYTLHVIKRRKEGRRAIWIGHILHRNCLLKTLLKER